jgi:hypothetical protein
VSVAARLRPLAEATGQPLAALRRQHLLDGALRRWSRSAQARTLVLRGGLMTKLWVGAERRATRDIDFVGLYPRDADETVVRMEEVLKGSTEPDDEVRFDVGSLRAEVIWQETEFPGVRLLVQAAVAGEEMELQIDVGFGDPLVPPAEWIDYPAVLGSPSRVQAVRPELLTAWKLDGLFDHGVRRWLAKDLYDLDLLTAHVPMDEATLAEAIRVAFAAHSDPLEGVLEVIYARSWWQTPSATARWEKFRQAAGVPVPADLLGVAGSVARRLRPALGRVVEFTGGEWLGDVT